MRTLNLGILAHVDAGKTSLTERLLYAAGIIDEIGSVDAGNTQTDTLELERQRGITIKAAVVSFAIADVTVNLIDTPGHPDFIAEVERVLGVLDGVVLVISAVEAVQAQTRVLMRTLTRLRIPTIIFVNKIDRRGAGDERVLHAIREKLTPAIVAMGRAYGLGARSATFVPYDGSEPEFARSLTDVLAEHDDALIAAFLRGDASVPYGRLRRVLATQSKRALVHPVFFGSAITGAGIEALMQGIVELLPAEERDVAVPPRGTVFKVERGRAGDKIAYVRLFTGTIHVRDRVAFGNGKDAKVTAIAVFEQGTTVPAAALTAGRIAKAWGLDDVRIGDTVGVPQRGQTPARNTYFAPPTLEAVVLPRQRGHLGALFGALSQLAEQDPLINVRQDDVRQEIFVSLYGEVQKQVIEATLANDFGLAVEFLETTTICVERPAGTGSAVEILQAETHPFTATIGLRVEPGPIGSGIHFRLDIDERHAPRYIYKSVDNFIDAMRRYVTDAFVQGLHGWQVTDCIVTMHRCGYYVGDGPGKPSGNTPRTTAAHFRKLTPLVAMQALARAGTDVCEPIHRFELEVREDSIAAVLGLLNRLQAAAITPTLKRETYVVHGRIPAAHVHELQRRLPSLTRGEAMMESEFAHYQRVRGAFPTRTRTGVDPLNRKAYLLHVASWS
jgi:ribosomal protection tetracycline resistance protein